MDAVGVILGVTELVGVTDGVTDAVAVLLLVTVLLGVLAGVMDALGVLAGVAEGVGGVQYPATLTVAVADPCKNVRRVASYIHSGVGDAINGRPRVPFEK